MALGFLVLLFAGLLQGSFGRGYKNYEPFSWGAFWGIYNIMAIIITVAFAMVMMPEGVKQLFGGGFGYVIKPVLCGVVWGLSAICFSKGISMVGMSLVYGISMGISTISGSVTPMILDNSFPKGSEMIKFILALGFTIAGVVIITIAGIKRDGKAKSSVLGIVMSILSGLGTGAMNLGFTFTSDINSTNQFGGSAVRWLLVLVGGCIAGLIYCIGEVSVLKQWHTVTDKGAAKCSVKLFGTAVIWYFALILYGVSSIMIGKLGNTVGWILFNSLALFVSVFWGVKDGEWKNKKKTMLFVGCVVLIIAWVFSALMK